jgi:hypothetical protein
MSKTFKMYLPQVIPGMKEVNWGRIEKGALPHAA